MDERVLEYGDRAVDDIADAVLDDSVLGLAGGKKSPTKKGGGGKLLVIVADGFPPYSDASEELAEIQANRWHPQTEDFGATAGAVVRTYSPAKNASEFFGAIAQQARISRLVFVGHGGPGSIGLTGTREGGFYEQLGSDELAANAGTIASLITKFDAGATIDLVCCNVAVSESFVSQLATAFRRCVRAFKSEVFWQHPLNADGTAIDPAERGLTSIDNASFKKGFTHLKFPDPVCP
jgi:Domain of unknown function (DUF4347)